VTTRSARADLKSLYGGGLGDTLAQEIREQNMPSLPTDTEEDYPVMTIKHKRRAAVLKDILKQGGYGDLAKMVNIRRG
jgi:hypothetical protein